MTTSSSIQTIRSLWSPSVIARMCLWVRRPPSHAPKQNDCRGKHRRYRKPCSEFFVWATWRSGPGEHQYYAAENLRKICENGLACWPTCPGQNGHRRLSIPLPISSTVSATMNPDFTRILSPLAFGIMKLSTTRMGSVLTVTGWLNNENLSFYSTRRCVHGMSRKPAPDDYGSKKSSNSCGCGCRNCGI